MRHSVAKNTLFMTLASIGQKIVAFVYFALIARSLGPESAGKYVTALTFTTLFVVLVDLGMTNVLVREAARVKHEMQKYVSTVLATKFFLGIVSYVLVIVVSLFLYPEDTELRHLIALSGLTMLFDSVHLTIYGVLRAIGDLRFESVSVTASQLFSLLLGGTFLFLKLPLIYLILAFTIPSAINVLFSSFILYKKYRIRAIPHFDRAVFLFLARITVPFALAAIFARVYSYMDSILLSKLMGTEAVGWYSTPYKITFAFQFLPLAVIAAVYPRLSEYFVSDRIRLAHLFEKTFQYLLWLSVPIAFGISVLSEPIILLVFGTEYIPSIVPLKILIISLVFSFISFPIGAILNACNKQATQTTIVGLVMLLNIVLNLLLIPMVGVSGAALAALFGNMALAVSGYVFVKRVAPISHERIFASVFRTLFAGGIMAVVVFLLREYFLPVPVLIGAVVYLLLLFSTREISWKEIKTLKQQLK